MLIHLAVIKFSNGLFIKDYTIVFYRSEDGHWFFKDFRFAISSQNPFVETLSAYSKSNSYIQMSWYGTSQVSKKSMSLVIGFIFSHYHFTSHL